MTPDSRRRDAITLHLTYLVFVFREQSRLAATRRSRELTRYEEQKLRRAEGLQEELEDANRELGELGVERPADDLSGVEPWPEAGWWSGLRIRAMAFVSGIQSYEGRTGRIVLGELSALESKVRNVLGVIKLRTDSTSRISDMAGP